MNDRSPTTTTFDVQRQALEEEFFAAYICWSDANEEVEAAYVRWRRATDAAERSLAYGAYLAALDREVAAAAAYEWLSRKLDRHDAAAWAQRSSDLAQLWSAR